MRDGYDRDVWSAGCASLGNAESAEKQVTFGDVTSRMSESHNYALSILKKARAIRDSIEGTPPTSAGVEGQDKAPAVFGVLPSANELSRAIEKDLATLDSVLDEIDRSFR